VSTGADSGTRDAFGFEHAARIVDDGIDERLVAAQREPSRQIDGFAAMQGRRARRMHQHECAWCEVSLADHADHE